MNCTMCELSVLYWVNCVCTSWGTGPSHLSCQIHGCRLIQSIPLLLSSICGPQFHCQCQEFVASFFFFLLSVLCRLIILLVFSKNRFCVLLIFLLLSVLSFIGYCPCIYCFLLSAWFGFPCHPFLKVEAFISYLRVSLFIYV